MAPQEDHKRLGATHQVEGQIWILDQTGRYEGITSSEYARARGIDKEPAFELWVPIL